MPFEPAIVAPADRSPRALFFPIAERGVVLARENGQPKIPDRAMLEAAGIDASSPQLLHYLGRLDGDDCFAVPCDVTPAKPLAVESLRGLFLELGEELFGIAGRATQIVDWARTHRFCGRCATPTERAVTERAMRCPNCGLSAYPRVAPAIIVLVRRGERALLARSGKFPVRFHSTLAGFVEPGESLESTVHREVMEEVGIAVKDVRYFGSQPWPFPHSLMVGFLAEHAGGEIEVDGDEIAEAAWYERDALPLVPPPGSIAGQLIASWVSGTGHQPKGG